MSLCFAGCGFYGKEELMGLCSRCHKEQVGGHSPAAAAKPAAIGKVSVLRMVLKTPQGAFLEQRERSNRVGGVIQCLDCGAHGAIGIVNAANSSLDHASGLAGAITKKGGPRIQAESDTYVAKNGRLEDGGVAVTTAGLLPCKSVIHAVGPTWRDGNSGEELMLQVAVRNCLVKATSLSYKSISLPAISSGIFGFPKVMFDIAMDYLKTEKTSLAEIRFTNFDETTVAIFEEECKKRGGTKP